MSIVIEAFSQLYPEKELTKNTYLKYSRAFKAYNANVHYNSKKMEFRLSHKWKDISENIQIGLIQSLMNKVYDTDVKTFNIELYDIFLKKLPNYTKTTKKDPVLEESFERVNEEYFSGTMALPNVEFAGKNFRTLGTYEYNTDTIRISRLLKKDPVLLDYVMYHEMLHKKFKYQQRGKRTIHHSKKFREWERRFKVKDVEKRLNRFLRKERILNTYF